MINAHLGQNYYHHYKRPFFLPSSKRRQLVVFANLQNQKCSPIICWMISNAIFAKLAETVIVRVIWIWRSVPLHVA